MSEYTFKPLNEVDTVEAPADGTTIMGFQGGVPIQMPMGAVKSGVFLIDPESGDFSTTSSIYGNKIKDALLAGKTVWIRVSPSQETTTNPIPTTIFSYNAVWEFCILKGPETADGYTLDINGGEWSFAVTFDEGTSE